MIRLALLLLAFATTALAETRAETARRFADWRDTTLWPLAEAEGISAETFRAAFDGVTLDYDIPGLVLPGTDTTPQGVPRQAEFRSPARYFREGATEGTAAVGRRYARAHAAALARATETTGVPGHILLAIWGRESGFGQVDIPHDAIEILATRAFFAREPRYLTSELIAALKIVDSGLAAPRALRSSWAGALGQPQFMPRSYLAYAADGNSDGAIDIWSSEADTIASIASFLAQHGWVPGRDWGFEVAVPASVSCTLEGPDRTRTIAEWEKLGIARVSGRPFPDAEVQQTASLLMPAGRGGPAFLVTPNFYAIKSYNRSDLYALFIGHVGDRIAYGVGPFRGAWEDPEALTRGDVATIQTALTAQGLDTGGADGLAGVRTRRSIGEWQERTGRAATCWPDRAIAAALE